MKWLTGGFCLQTFLTLDVTGNQKPLINKEIFMYMQVYSDIRVTLRTVKKGGVKVNVRACIRVASTIEKIFQIQGKKHYHL